jgi:hypothetical protein
MLQKLKSRAELAQELGIHPRTLSIYMKTLGISWGEKLMPPVIWEKVLSSLGDMPTGQVQSKVEKDKE